MIKRILVIEDDLKHLQDSKDFFKTQEDVEVTYVSNYSDAKNVMFGRDKETFKRIKGNIDGVISDVYFPLTSHEKWNQPEPMGVKVAVELTQMGIPFVLNTSGYHHGRRYEWINQFAREQRWELIDSGSDEKDADSKNWSLAYKRLSYLIDN